jgi:hypothetical protein
MKKILAAIMVVVMLCSVALAAGLLGTKKHPFNNNKYRTTWAHPSSTSESLINATGATTAYGVSFGCNGFKVKVGDITGTGIMNIAVQVADMYGPEFGDSPQSDSLFTNAVGTTAAPWHPVDPSDTDSYTFYLEEGTREFTVWRLNCLAGCTATNYIETAWGDCWMAGQGGR